MPVDYSKWDALELSDDSDIEVHPNVDKRSFIRAKQNQIHQERQQRKHQIETLKYERIINDALTQRLTSLLTSLKARAADAGAGSRNPGEVAFEAVMESAASVDPKDDQPPPRPEGVHNKEEALPTYSKMMATLLDQVNKALDEKKVPQDKRYAAMVAELEDHLNKVHNLQKDLLKKLAELEKEEGRKITSESIHTGFDSSFVNKSKPSASSSEKPSKESHAVELLNPNFSATSSKPTSSTAAEKTTDDDDELEASPAGKEFAAIPPNNYNDSLVFLSSHREILTERETDALLVLAFDAALAGRDDRARQYVHQALLLQYCRALGRDGVALFFRRITTPGHQARDVFFKDVSETYARIRGRATEINAERAKDGGAAGGVEQIQLHAVEPGTVIQVRVPPVDAQDEESRRARAIFDGFRPEMRKALETGSLDKVNKVLGEMDVAEAEELVEKFGEANILSLEEGVIDATTEAGQAQLKQMEQQAAATTTESAYADDPE